LLIASNEYLDMKDHTMSPTPEKPIMNKTSNNFAKNKHENPLFLKTPINECNETGDEE